MACNQETKPNCNLEWEPQCKMSSSVILLIVQLLTFPVAYSFLSVSTSMEDLNKKINVSLESSALASWLEKMAYTCLGSIMWIEYISAP
jgi:hypothetical protein